MGWDNLPSLSLTHSSLLLALPRSSSLFLPGIIFFTRFELRDFSDVFLLIDLRMRRRDGVTRNGIQGVFGGGIGGFLKILKLVGRTFVIHTQPAHSTLPALEVLPTHYRTNR